MNVAPFPWASLEKLSRAEVAAASRLRRFVRSHVRTTALASELSEITKKRISSVERGVRRLDPSRSVEGAVGLLVSAADGSAVALIEVEAAFAAALVGAALSRAAPRVHDASRPAPPEIVGAVAAVLVAAARRAHADVVLRVIAAGPASRLARDFAAAQPEAVTSWHTVLLDDDAFDVRVSAAGSALPPASVEIDLASALGAAPISIPLVVARAVAARAEVTALSAGDAFVVPRAALSVKGQALVGPVMLVPSSGERGLGADLAEGGRLVLRGRVESSPWDPAMSDETGTTTMDVLEDSPVVVRVEIGVVEMKASEWAALGAGDVVTLGRRVGDPALLRVGGVEVARGELVQVDGEIGVKIIGRGSR